MRKANKFAAWTVALSAAVVGATTAEAVSLTQPGETIGSATGAPLPEGVFFVNWTNFGSHRALDDDSTLAVNVPLLIWATPWDVAGARVSFLGAAPGIYVRDKSIGLKLANMSNPFAAVSFAWDLGGGFGFTHYEGVYFPVDNALNQNLWAYNNRNAISYTADGWNLTAYSVLGFTGDNKDTGTKTLPDYLNVDLTATKTFGKWTIGGGAYGSTDISKTDVAGYKKQGQIAVGPYLGYDFGSFSLQGYVTHDVAIKNNNHRETRVWTRLVLPVWVAPQPAAPVVAKY